MRKFNRGYAIFFLLILLAAWLGARYSYQRAQPYFQTQAQTFSAYSLDDWITFFKLDDTLGDPLITPVPADQYPFPLTPAPTATPEA